MSEVSVTPDRREVKVTPKKPSHLAEKTAATAFLAVATVDKKLG